MTDPLTALRDVPVPAGLDADPIHARIDELALARPRRRGLPAGRAGRSRSGALARPRRRGLPALALVAASVAAGVVVLTTGGRPTTTRPAAATAATVLHALGKRAAAEPPLRLGEGEYYAVRIRQYAAAGKDARSVDSRTWARGEAGREQVLVDGKVKADDRLGTPASDERGGVGRIADPATLPTEPKALAARMREEAAKFQIDPGESPTARDYLNAATLMVFGRKRTPPAVLRAVYDFLATLPGMRLIGDVTDPLGRPGKAVAVDGDPDIHEGIGIELMVAPETGEPLAVVHYRDGDVNDPWLYTTRQAGVVHGTDTLPG
ncbi:hypothetical protein [Solirubrobacter soli]|uniref:hypothetical protein n=1 Tax=Solirubrobacter soli TaxID=363832 RepID=UPI00041313FE|nr:hypothetical protein [Solirubrobacter soli]